LSNKPNVSQRLGWRNSARPSAELAGSWNGQVLSPLWRFGHLFPIAAEIVRRPERLVLGTCLAASIAAIVSVHLVVSILALGTFVVLVSLHRRYLDNLLMVPAIAGSIWPLTSVVFGAGCLAASSGWNRDGPLLMSQLALLYGIACVGVAIVAVFRGMPAVSLPLGSRQFSSRVLRPLAVVAWVLIAMQIAYYAFGVASGRLDRGEFGEAASESPYLALTPLDLVHRFIGSCLILWPAAWLTSGLVGRAVLALLLTSLILLGAITGTRGLVIVPLAYMLVGAYLFLSVTALQIRVAACILVFVAVIVLPAMVAFRDSEQFFHTPAWDLSGRMAILMESAQASSATETFDSEARLAAVGTHLLGIRDPVVYAGTPDELPHAGWERIDDALTAWLPQYFAPNRAPLMDGDEIVERYVGYQRARSFATISLEADLFRRWGWVGTLVGVPVFSLLFALSLRAAFSVLMYRDALLGFTLLPLVMASMVNRPASTLLWTFQIWTYDIPKHVVFALILVWIARRISGVDARIGLIELRRHPHRRPGADKLSAAGSP
jgi:hypothetical protein